MALSSYYNCNAVHTTLNPEISPFTSNEAELAWELLFNNNEFEDDGFSSVPDYLLDFYSDPAACSFSCTDICPYLLPPTFPGEPIVSLPTEMFLLDETNYEPLPHPKRHKSFHNQQSVFESQPAFVDGFVMNSCEVLPAQLQVTALPHEFNFTSEANHCGENIVTEDYKKVEEKGTVSTQSVAARERRRKISEKTQELGKLIPGGNKMNTAEMFQAASNYVKYLQAQVAVLELMDKLKESEGSAPTEDMQVLLASSSVQGKLYSKEHCIVPKEFVVALANRSEVQSRQSVHHNLVKLIKSDD